MSPSVSRFHGIVVSFNFEDHNPPHFHARYAEHRATIRIDTLMINNGYLPNRVERTLRKWALLNHKELQEAWEAAQRGEAFQIPPL